MELLVGEQAVIVGSISANKVAVPNQSNDGDEQGTKGHGKLQRSTRLFRLAG